MNRKKIFGIVAVFLMLLVTIAPTVCSSELVTRSVSEEVDNDWKKITCEEHNRLSVENEDVKYIEYEPGAIVSTGDPQVAYFDGEHAVVGGVTDDAIAYVEKLTGCPCVDRIPELEAALFQMTNMSVQEFITLTNDLEVTEYAEMNILVGNFWEPNDPFYEPDQWNLRAISCPEAWDKTKGDDRVILAVLDTGFYFSHLDKPLKIAKGRDFVNHDGDPQDDCTIVGHGTHCTGIAVARTNNDFCIAGVCPEALVYAIKVLDENGYGWSWSIAAAIVLAAASLGYDADIISMSFGGGYSILMNLACGFAYYGKNKLLVAASGNEGDQQPCYPARYSSVIAVGAVDRSLDRTPWSNKGVEIVAPGENILSLDNTGQYGFNVLSGTSMATPHIAGVAALVYAALLKSNKEKRADVVRRILHETADDLGQNGFDDEYGSGLVNANTAVIKALTTPPGRPKTNNDRPNRVISKLLLSFLQRVKKDIPLRSSIGKFVENLELKISTEKKDYKWLSEQVNITISIKNNGDENIKLIFPTLKKFDYSVRNLLKIKIYKWSDKKYFKESVIEIDIPAGETVEYKTNWNQRGHILQVMPLRPILPGTYYITGEIPTMSGALKTNTVEIKLH